MNSRSTVKACNEMEVSRERWGNEFQELGNVPVTGCGTGSGGLRPQQEHMSNCAPGERHRQQARRRQSKGWTGGGRTLECRQR